MPFQLEKIVHLHSAAEKSAAARKHISAGGKFLSSNFKVGDFAVNVVYAGTPKPQHIGLGHGRYLHFSKYGLAIRELNVTDENGLGIAIANPQARWNNNIHYETAHEFAQREPQLVKEILSIAAKPANTVDITQTHLSELEDSVMESFSDVFGDVSNERLQQGCEELAGKLRQKFPKHYREIICVLRSYALKSGIPQEKTLADIVRYYKHKIWRW